MTVKSKGKKRLRRMVFTVLLLFVVYFAIGGIIMGVQLGSMNKQNEVAQNVALGEARMEELNRQGVSVEYNLYHDDEIKADESKEAAKLYYFPNEQNQKSKFVIVCPGGSYTSCAVSAEGYPSAAELNKLGYTAFVLEYRAGENGGNYAAIDDLAAAVSYITEHAEEFQVEASDYALLGYSAGGDLVGLFGTETIGYAKYDGVEKPSMIMMGYPWCNQNIKSANLAKCMMYTVLNSMGYKGLIGKGATSQEKMLMRVPWQVTENYPNSYVMHGTDDVLVPAATHSDVLAEAFDESGVVYQYERAAGVNHGCGIGTDTSAEGWLSRAVAFWEECLENNR